MKSIIKVQKAIVGKVIELSYDDMVAISIAFGPLVQAIKDDDELKAYNDLSWEERDKKDETGKKVHVKPTGCTLTSSDIVKVARKIMPFINKISAHTSDSNVFDEECDEEYVDEDSEPTPQPSHELCE